MNETNWITAPDIPDNDNQFIGTVKEMHQQLYEKYFLQDLMVNHQLDITIRAYRKVEQWRLLLVLTPWMYARIMVPDQIPDIEIPSQWTAQNRKNKAYTVLGPAVHIPLLGNQQQAHLNYAHELGHYLLQPLAMNMAEYQSSEEVFEKWNDVIKTRNDNMEKHHRECSWQKEVSRREFFTRMLQN